jgi:hypothetical protein
MDRAQTGRISVRKSEKNRTAKRTVSKSVRQAAASKKKSASRARKPVRRVAIFKSTDWYQRVAQSIGISARAAS